MSETSSSPKPSWKRWAVWILIPFGLGTYLSHTNVGSVREYLSPLVWMLSDTLTQTTSTSGGDAHSRILGETTSKQTLDVEKCWNRQVLPALGGAKKAQSIFSNWKLSLHRNGQASPCGNSTAAILLNSMKESLQELKEQGRECPKLEKYHVESFLTLALSRVMTACTSEEPQRSSKRDQSAGLLGYCDMGEAYTPILGDHSQHLPNVFQKTQTSYLPCHFHDDNGVRLTSWMLLSRLVEQTAATDNNENGCVATSDGDDETCVANGRGDLVPTLHLYAVPAGRVFMHVPQFVGQIINLPHVRGGDPSKPVYLEVLSVSPAVFDLHNFFTTGESEQLVAGVLKEKRDSHRIKRSETGVNKAKTHNRKRTSESGFDTDSKVSVEIRKRCFDVLGFDEYVDSFGDGLQILRYNLTKAYIPHMDYLDISPTTKHDYDSGKKGGNRFATILLYMTDLEPGDGGETVFVNAWPPGQTDEEHVELGQALKELRESDQHGILEEGSWEEKMVAQCRTRLAVRPQSGRAVLFYSQLPNGKEDKQSLHGGCPVLSGTKVRGIESCLCYS